jgi:hypothetical protein
MLDPTIKVAIIAAIPPTLAVIVTAFVSNRATNQLHGKLSTIEVNTNHRLDLLLQQRNAATTRADRAEGLQAGLDSMKG